MPEYNPYILWLAANSVPKLGAVGLRQMWTQYQSIEKLWHALVLDSAHKKQLLQQAEKHYQVLEKEGIYILIISESDYPKSIIDIKDLPIVLYAKGHLDLLKQTILAVVGSRTINQYGSEVTQQLVKQLVTQKVIIASGMAMGIDTTAHEAALASSAPTIAVLGCGLDKLDYDAHDHLATRIANQGLLLSQFPLGIEPQKFTFPARNRLLAGISQAVIVTQANRHSGSLLTAAAARDYGRPIYAVPGSIFNPGSAGTHQLLSQGARLAVDGAAIVKMLTGLSNDVVASSAIQPPNFSLTALEEQLLHLLQAGSLATDQLIRTSHQSAADVLASLSGLEMKSLIVNSQGEYRLVS